MDYNKKNKKKFNNKNRKDNSRKDSHKKEIAFVAENIEEIKAYKENVRICEFCTKPINDLSSALIDKKNGGAIHFDCVLSRLKETEKLEENEKISYIGQGKFAVIHFENPQDLRKFTIVRTIEWENHDEECTWRDEIAGLFSTVR